MQTIKEISQMIRLKQAKPSDITRQMLDKIAKKNSSEHIFITISEDLAMQQAQNADQELEKGLDKGILHGIPYTLKDLFKTAGVKTTGGSRVLADNVPDHDAALVQILNGNGSVMLGKVNLHEFAYGATGHNLYYGTVRNPYDETRLAGGSSSGSAAAVARGYGLFSLGTDTGGSVRVPAALCGVAGFKPSYGLLSTEGVIPYCWSLDHVGIIAKTAVDTKMVLDALLQRPVTYGIAGSLKGLKIGLPETFFYDDLDKEIGAAMELVKKKFTSLGAKLISVALPDLANSRTASLIIQLPEVLSYHSQFLKEKGELYSEDMLAGMAAGQFILAEQYLAAKRMATFYKDEFSKVFNTVDLLLTPSTPCIAPKTEQNFVDIGGQQVPAGNAVTRFFSIFNITGNPSITVPAGFHSSGLPMGFQLVGAVGNDDAVMDAAISYEENT